MYKSILLPVEIGHGGSWEKSLPVALDLAEKCGAKLHLVTNVPDVGMSIVSSYLPSDFEARALQKAADELDAFAEANVPADVRGESHVAHGVTRREIVNTADKLGCDLIIMSPHRPEMMDLVISPNTATVVERAKCSVLVVR